VADQEAKGVERKHLSLGSATVIAALRHLKLIRLVAPTELSSEHHIALDTPFVHGVTRSDFALFTHVHFAEPCACRRITTALTVDLPKARYLSITY
jgi:hypothetical protein